MVRRSHGFAGLGIGFVLVLLFVTLKSTPAPLREGRGALAEATRECQRSIQESVSDARFPFEPTMSDLQGDGILLSGTIDSGSGLQAERRNYSCYLSVRAESGSYVADSLEIWKSH